jgi:methyl-accepting chemotaxis protein
VQMEHVVQQNASLVEEATAATESMKEQAASLLRMVSRFRIGDTDAGAGDAPVLAAAGMQGALPGRARTSLPFLRSAGAK